MASPPMPPSLLSRLTHPTPWRSIARGTASVLIVAATVVPIVCMSWTALGEAAHHSFAAGFRFADARVATEYAGAVASRPLFGAPAADTSATGSWRAAPIV